jgi:hypothetical protein
MLVRKMRCSETLSRRGVRLTQVRESEQNEKLLQNTTRRSKTQDKIQLNPKPGLSELKHSQKMFFLCFKSRYEVNYGPNGEQPLVLLTQMRAETSPSELEHMINTFETY